MKKRAGTKLFSVIIFSLLFISLLTTIVAAQEGVIDFTSILEFLIGEYSGTAGALTIKLLVAIIFALIFYVALTSIDLFKGKIVIPSVISILLTIIGVKFIPNDWLIAMFLPTSAYILAGSLVFQFALLVYINYKIFKDSPVLRRMMWYTWSAALFLLLVRYGIWNIRGISPFVTNYLGWQKPAFILPWPAIVLYLVAVLSATTLGVTIDNWFAKINLKSDVEQIEKNLEKARVARKVTQKHEQQTTEDIREGGKGKIILPWSK